MFPFTGHVTNKKWPLNEVRRWRTPPKESDIRPTTDNPSDILFTAGVRAAPGAAAASRPHQPREHSPAPRGRAEAGTHYTYTIPYLLNYTYYIYNTLFSISTALYLHHIYSTIFTIPRLAPLTFTQFVLPFLVLAGGLASAAAAFLCEITCWRNKAQHQGKIRKMTWTWKDY